eukprot:4126159-Prymnesium_polylepis.1
MRIVCVWLLRCVGCVAATAAAGVVRAPCLALAALRVPSPLTLSRPSPRTQGIAGMKCGATRRIIVPAALGYGARGSGPILPNATLVFEVHLDNVQ